MRAVFLSAITILLIVWLGHPYLSGASEKISASTQPAALDAGLKQVHGHGGYWRLAEDRSGVWWFVSPDDHLEFLNMVTTVQPYQLSRLKDGPHFVSQDWVKGDINHWAEATVKRVFDTGFKGLGAWSNPAFHSLDVPMTQDLNVWAWIDDASRRFYTPEWREMADHAIKTQVEPLATNKNLVGYYIDNELDWGDGFSGPSAYFDHLPEADPNRQQVLGIIHSLWPVIGDFNLAWGTKFGDWSTVEHWQALPKEPARAYDRLSSAWLSHLARDYFQATTSLIHKYDGNHLILGVRFKGYAPAEVVKASANLTDAQSLNYYVGDAKLDQEMFRMMYMDSGQPIIISEYSFHAMDGKSGNGDTVGFSAQVPDQQARADGYRLMTTRLARVPYIVGADWFQWCDEPPAGRSGDGEDVNFGVVNIEDKPYDALVEAIRQTESRLDPLHAGSCSDGDKDVRRDSYATKPVMHVPFLAVSPKLDGQLSDWVPASKLNDMRREQTIGMDRSKIPTPNVYLGWNRSGLFMGMEVFDNQILITPAKGWWWTRDHVEWWISTRPVASDLNSYDVNCHQFFFVPGDVASTGVVGQWHRDGDAIKDNLIPATDVQSALKVLPDRYEVEIFIPSKALHGYDPEHEPAMEFNIDVRDFQSAADFFWSAPKSVQTQLRPNTWGALYLDAPAGSLSQARTN